MQLPAVCKKINIWTPKYATTILLGSHGEGACSLPDLFLESLPGPAVSPTGPGCCMHMAPPGPDGRQKQQKKSRATLSRYFSKFEIAEWFHTGRARCIGGRVF